MNAQPNIGRPPNSLLIFAAIALLLGVAGTASIALYLGAFNQPVLSRVTAPGYRLFYIGHTGPYNEIKDVFKQAKSTLEGAGITPVAPAALFLDDPARVAREKLRSRIGYLVHDGDRLPAGLAEEIVGAREIIDASFNGSPMIGSYKAYPAMRQWSADHHYQLALPSLEIYYPDGHVEYQLPIQRVQ